MYPVLTLMIAAGLAFIPANIAKQKGHSFGLWWVYGWLLFIVAIIHVQFIKDYSAQTPVGRPMEYARNCRNLPPMSLRS